MMWWRDEGMTPRSVEPQFFKISINFPIFLDTFSFFDTFYELPVFYLKWETLTVLPIGIPQKGSPEGKIVVFSKKSYKN